MTFTDKKIDEFRKEHWNNKNPSEEDKIIIWGQEEAVIFENWLRKTIAEAKKDELYEVRKILRDNDDPVVWEKIREKILELERE